jgi:tetratricopeptide (TPR) repeat protein
LNNLGLALEAIDDLTRAERCYRDALAVEPHHADALGNLASVLYDRHDRQTSAALYRQLLAIRRDLPAAVLNRHAMVEEEVGSLETAEAGFRAALDAAPTDRRIQINLASLLVVRQKYVEAEPLIEEVLDLEPRQATALTLSMKVHQNLCKWDGFDEIVARLVERVMDESPSHSGEIDPFVLLSAPVPREVHLRASQRWAKRFAPKVSSPLPHVRLAPGERPRVAFISSDFRLHPMVQTISECFERSQSRSHRGDRLRHRLRKTTDPRSAHQGRDRVVRRRQPVRR